MLLLRYALLTKNQIIQKVPGGIPSENLFLCFLRISFSIAPYNDLPADLVALLADSFQFQNHFSQKFFFAQLHESRFLGFRINCRSSFQPIEHSLSSALLTTAAAMIIFFVVRVALIRAVVPVCLICAVVWIVLICVMVQLFFAVGVARYSVFFTHFSFSFNLQRFRIQLLSLSRDAHESVFRLPSSVEINPLFLRWYHDGK